ncbi:MAG TPA: hypothetical protein VJ889_19365, partial [Pseudomonas sp.]|nr:hypothetical protein [Pseudomonas sp.]
VPGWFSGNGCVSGFFDRVHIRFFGNGGLWFRLYGGLLGRAPSNQGLLPLTFGASPRHGQILGIDPCQLKTVTYVLELFCYLCG